MGKTAIVAALIAANPASVKPISDADFKKVTTTEGMQLKVKLTVVIVNNTLVRQGSDEFKKARAETRASITHFHYPLTIFTASPTTTLTTPLTHRGLEPLPLVSYVHRWMCIDSSPALL